MDVDKIWVESQYIEVYESYILWVEWPNNSVYPLVYPLVISIMEPVSLNPNQWIKIVLPWVWAFSKIKPIKLIFIFGLKQGQVTFQISTKKKKLTFHIIFITAAPFLW